MNAIKLTPKAATQPQFDFIKRLLAERTLDIETEAMVGVARNLAVAGELTSQAASGLIDILKGQPVNAAPSTSTVQAGVYQDDDGRLLRVYNGQQSGRMLVKEITVGEDGTGVAYEYLGAAARVLPANAKRMPVEAVGALGKQWDHCLMCGRRLDDPESVDRGIGPVCAGKYDA